MWTNNETHVTTATRRRILQRDGHQCTRCGSTTKLEVDHIHNLKAGGTNKDYNLQTLCHACHQRKTQREAYRARTRHKRRPRPGLGMKQ